jgi:DNA-binding NarL/FixJ family response regulator
MGSSAKAPGAARRRRPAPKFKSQVWPGWQGRRSPARCRIVLIDDHVVVRDGIAALLALETDLEVVGSAGSVASGVELVRTTQPDLVVCDLNLPGISGGQAVQALRRSLPGVVILVLTAHDSLEYVRAAFISGAIGYVCKDAPRSELLRAVRRAACGRRTVCGPVWDAVMADWLQHYKPPEPQEYANLGDDERRVLRHIALGVPTWRIAGELGRGVKAVEKYRMALMRRLGLRSAAAATRFAIEHRLVSSSELDTMLEVRET